MLYYKRNYKQTGTKLYINLHEEDGLIMERVEKFLKEAKMIEPFSDTYTARAQYKKIPVEALKKLEPPMNLICVTPTKMEVL